MFIRDCGKVTLFLIAAKGLASLVSKASQLVLYEGFKVSNCLKDFNFTICR